MNQKTNRPRYIQASQCDNIPIDVKNIKRFKKNKTEFYNYPVAFDIETSSFRDEDGEPRACMYVWQMCFGDSDFIVVGRTWEEWLDFIKLIRKTFHLKKDRILVIYVHNLAYEFQWIRTFFKWQKVFSLDKRVPLYARTNFGIEFRCSYRLSGYSLSTLAKNLTRHEMRKLDTLDYKLIRHSKTPITELEMDYNIEDVRIVCAYISERLEIDGNITKIPLTKTGYVRNACKIACYGENHKATKYYRYREEMQRLTMDVEEYLLMRCAFMGGFTHANSWYVGQTITDGVTSQDFTSSYPYVMFAEKYPWSKGKLCYPDIEEVMKNLNTYAWILDLELYDIESKIIQEDFLPFSRCVKCQNYVLNNGRINRAGYVHVVLTSVDLEILLKTYRFNGGIKIVRAYKYFLKYLPTDFVDEMLSYYENKTTLKGVAGKEEEYLYFKEQLNSTYGMAVTSPIRPTINYTDSDEWESEEIDVTHGVEKYNKNPNRFIPYIVGVFVTAYARRNLWSGILAVGDDYVYADTDSIKMLNYESHKDYFEEYNKEVMNKLQRACDYHGFDISRVTPKTVKGVTKILGVWDFDGFYTRFKTLGAKRYMTEEDGDISLTVSGLNKKQAIPYLLNKYGRDKIFDAFTDDEFGIDNMVIPAGHSGRMVSTYIDEETQGTVTDYLGNVGTYHEHTSINLEESTYTLSLAKDYYMFLLGIRKEVY